MRYLTILSVFLILASCSDNPCNCPPPDKSPDASKTTALPDTNQGVDSATLEDDTDTDSFSVQFGGTPSEVTSFELHGRAGFDKVNVFEKPDMDSPRLGYLRKGQRTMVGDPKFASESCPKGWFKLPEGGFVCQGRGMLVGTKPRFIRKVPPIARVDQLDPFRHGFIRKDWTPSYKRIPTTEEIWEAPEREVFDTEAEEDEAQMEGTDTVEPEMEIIPHLEDENDTDGIDYHKYTKRKFKAVRQLLSRGFWVSVAARRFDEETRRYYYETVKNDYVPGENVHLIKPPKFQGYEVLGESPLPAVIVRGKHASFFTVRNGKFRGAGPVKKHSSYHVLEESANRGVTYYKIEGDRWLKSSQVEYFGLSELPEGLKDGEKWIRVNLTRQTLEAYEGTMPVYVTLVSTGLAGNEETVTPRGKFRIRFKHLTNDMTGSVGDNEDVYSVADVPWVQYLHLNIAFHASFWHSSYGRPKSHGCINLSPADARWLFNWSEPGLPTKWYGVAATENTPGTLVIIEGTTPK